MLCQSRERIGRSWLRRVIRVTLEQPERKETPETQAPRAKLGRKVL